MSNRSTETVTVCDERGHHWEYCHDWEGDPSIPNGTNDWYYKRCRRCDAHEPWDGRPEEEDPDDARDRERDDAIDFPHRDEIDDF